MGYYNQKTDKTASFQLVLRGPDYPTPANEGNVGFFYKDVQWETGNASGGIGGFGGRQAAVGFSDGLSALNPGEFLLPGSQQPGISELVSNNYYWFNLPTTGSNGDNGTGSGGASGGGGVSGGGGSGGGGYARARTRSDFASRSSTSVPESTPAFGLLALGVWAIVKALKINKDQDP
ncbi:MAG: nidogen-like domain-containing protein [Nostoc sp.]|uniref:nidogen-like domain-containing protein n=1 Tax=Nostoc sp. TaxID=1180 RepID=UPI002FFAD94A